MIVIKTALGAQVMKDRSVSLSAQQRSALILCDGKRSINELLHMTAGVGVTILDIEALADKALIDIIDADPSVPTLRPSAGLESKSDSLNSTLSPVDFRQARDTAIKICADLGFKGFSLNIAVVDAESIDQLKKHAPEIRRLAGDAKYRLLHEQLYGQRL
ncbi:MAG: hypothetical protein EAZ37_13880 [Burkholderiales bacterium]|nr:MAG: hypothetical protein EAZ37_13880 [Burkholderiales bacterium]